MAIEEEIREIVKKNLPQQHAGVLNDYIKESEDIRGKYKDLIRSKQTKDEEYSYETEKNRKNSTKIVELETYIKNHEHEFKTIEEGSRQLTKDKLEFESRMLKERLDQNKATTDKLFNLVEMIFRNKVITINESGNVPIKDQYGNSTSQQFSSFKTIEETK